MLWDHFSTLVKAFDVCTQILPASTVRFISMALTSSAVGKNDEASSLSKFPMLPVVEREELYARGRTIRSEYMWTNE